MTLAIDLFCGLGGWSNGLIAEGWRHVIGFDIERHEYGGERYPGQLVIQDVRTLDGAQCKDADLIVASPPCQSFSHMAMPFTRGRQAGRALRGEDQFPDNYKGPRTIAELTELFDECFRIQREASAAAGRHIPMIVENVRGAQPWVGRAKWNFGSYYLWGDVPALMPMTRGRGDSWFAIGSRGQKVTGPNPDVRRTDPGKGARFTSLDCGEDRKNPGFRFDGSGRSFQTASVNSHIKQGGLSGVRANGKGDLWFQDGAASSGSKSSARKAASAMIAKIPLTLARHIAMVYRPIEE